MAYVGLERTEETCALLTGMAEIVTAAGYCQIERVTDRMDE